MSLFTKIIIYGNKESEKWVTAHKLIQDNPMLHAPFMITDKNSMKKFLSTPNFTLGIISADCVKYIMKKCQNINFGPVLFIADPYAVRDVGDKLIREIVWNGSSPEKIIHKSHAHLAMENN